MTATEREGCTTGMRKFSIDKDSEAFKLITRIQDEAHRFAIKFHRKLRAPGTGALDSG